jgi:hypothetical protein
VVTAGVPTFLVVSTAEAVFLPFKLPKPCAKALTLREQIAKPIINTFFIVTRFIAI